MAGTFLRRLLCCVGFVLSGGMGAGCDPAGMNVDSGETSEADTEAAIARGRTTFTSMQAAAGGAILTCANCHGQDGSGLVAPDIRSSTVDHLVEHGQGDGPHPDGVKFTELTEEDFHDMGLYLASICEADADCTPGSDDEHGHE